VIYPGRTDAPPDRAFSATSVSTVAVENPYSAWTSKLGESDCQAALLNTSPSESVGEMEVDRF
jgi:hypothetical protein